MRKTEQPLFSVVIPAYNVRPYIERALASALDQSMPLEVIVVDDGSTDGTAEVAERCPGVRCIRQANAGVSAARNQGLLNANGHYVAFLDGDDQWLPGHLERAHQALAASEARWYACAFEDRDEEGRLLEDHSTHIRALLGDATYFDDAFVAWSRGVSISTITIVIERAMLHEIGGFCERLSLGEDLDLWFRAALRCSRIAFSAEIGAVYWHRDGSATKAPAPHRLSGMLWRIQRDRDLAVEEGASAFERAKPILGQWLAKAVRMAIDERRPEQLEHIEHQFGPLVPSSWRGAAALCRRTPQSVWPMLRRAALATSRS